MNSSSVGPGARIAVSVLCLIAWAGSADAPTPVRRLTNDGLRKEDLRWSPDGKTLACSYYARKGRVLVGLFAQPNFKPRILEGGPVDRAPAWSPDGVKFAFIHVTQSGTDGELDIYQMAIDGSAREKLVQFDGKSFENWPSWSPDGKRLVFTTTRDKTQELYCANAAGGEPVRLTSDPALKQYPCWTADGSGILFNASRDGNFDLYRIDAGGGGLLRLTSDPAMDVHPACSPDGKRVAFVSLRDGNPEVYVMNLDGSAVRRITEHPGYDFSPAWKPDGRTLTWVSDRGSAYDVYSVQP